MWDETLITDDDDDDDDDMTSYPFFLWSLENCVAC